MVKTEDGDLTDKGYLMEKIKKHINRFREMLREGLQGKIFRLCLIVIAVAVCCFAVLDIIQLQLLRETSRKNSETQAQMIKEQSLDSLEKSTELNLTQTARQSADNTDWELNMLRHDAVILAEQTEKILREPFPDIDEFELFASMTPAREVGGDFYDFFMVDDDHLALVIADVSGKGVPAALFMVIAKTLIKNAAQLGKSPAEIFGYVNEQLCDGNREAFFVTAWMGIIEISTGKGLAVNAGHEHPAIRRAAVR